MTSGPIKYEPYGRWVNCLLLTEKNVLSCLALDFILFILSILVNSGLGLKVFFNRDGQDIQDGQAKGIGEWDADLR